MSRSITVTFLGKDATLGKTLGDVDQKSSRLSSRMRSVGRAIVTGLAVAGAAGAVALVKMTQAAVDDEAAQVKLATTLRNTAGATDSQIASVERWITAQGKALGVTDDELRPALERLVTATGDVAEGQKLASLAMDVSAGTGKSLEQVSMALMRAQNGQIAGLSRLGIQTKNAKGETLTFEQAVRKMSDTYGGQAQAKAETLRGKLDRLRLIISETGEEIGARMIPVATKLADWFLNEGVPAISTFGGFLKSDVVPALSAVGSAFMAVVRFANDNRTAVVALAGAIAALVVVTQLHAAVLAVSAAGGLLKYLAGMKLVTTATKVWAAVQWVLNAALAANPIVLVIGLVVALGVAVVVAYKKSETFRKIVDGAFRAVGAAGKWLYENAIGPAFRGIQAIMRAVGAVGRWLWNNALAPAFRFIMRGAAAVMESFARMLRALSKVPGFGWAADAADKMDRAAGRARALADNIRNIPRRHDSNVNITYTFRRNGSPYTGPGSAPGFQQGNAQGTSYLANPLTWVGERGPELMELPRGSRIIPNNRLGNATAGGKIEVRVFLDGRELHQSLLRRQRTTGQALGLG